MGGEGGCGKATRTGRAVGNARKGLSSVRWVTFPIIAAHISRADKVLRNDSLEAIAVPVLMRRFEHAPEISAELLCSLGSIDRYEPALVEHLLRGGNGTAVLDLFAPSLDSFPEDVLRRVLDLTDLRSFVRAVAAAPSPNHHELHQEVVQRVVAHDMDLWLLKHAAQMLTTHPRSVRLRMLQSTVGDRERRHWLADRVQRASGELLIRDDGSWLS